MAARAKRDMTLEEFDAWSVARRKVADVLDVTAEEGGPRVSLVPVPTSVPLDFLPDEVTVPALVETSSDASAGRAVAFDPTPSRKAGGWCADRQRLFVETLAETGSVHMAAESAGLSARSAYALRVRSTAFATAWNAAQILAVGRLSALAFDRAIHGRVEQVYHDGQLVGEKRVPSERLLMWLLTRLDPQRFAAPWERRPGDTSDPHDAAHRALPGLLGALGDVAGD